jgi:hypothetical protein
MGKIALSQNTSLDGVMQSPPTIPSARVGPSRRLRSRSRMNA